MQTGGFDTIPIKDSDFKYTRDNDRILWTKNVFPIAEYIIQAIQTIPWSSYKFQGTSAFWVMTPGNTPIFEREDLKISTVTPTTPLYFYFGGSVYEIMNTLYERPGLPALHSYVDPTGDLDVMSILPRVILPPGKSSKEYLAYFFNELPLDIKKSQATRKNRKAFLFQENYKSAIRKALNSPELNANANSNTNTNAEPIETVGCKKNVFTGDNVTRSVIKRDTRHYSTFIEHYTDWIMDQFATTLQQYKKAGLFELLFGNTVQFNIENDAEGRFADRILCIGNLKLVRSYLPYMGLLKIQLIAKFQDMTRSDHICEFLLTLPNQPSIRETLKKYEDIEYKYHVLKGFPLSNFAELVRGNLDSLINRYSLYNTEIRHKFYNHVGRMQYLHDFFANNLNPYYEINPTKLTLSKKDYMELGITLAKFSFYIAENYFSKDIIHFDYKDRSNSSSSERSELRKSLVKTLLGSYPLFLLKKRKHGKYKSPFQTISFQEGDTLPARTEFVFVHLFDAVQSLPGRVLFEFKLDENDEINTLQLFLLLKYRGLVAF
jgi:hypothetical protein